MDRNNVKITIYFVPESVKSKPTLLFPYVPTRERHSGHIVILIGASVSAVHDQLVTRPVSAFVAAHHMLKQIIYPIVASYTVKSRILLHLTGDYFESN